MNQPSTHIGTFYVRLRIHVTRPGRGRITSGAVPDHGDDELRCAIRRVSVFMGNMTRLLLSSTLFLLVNHLVVASAVPRPALPHEESVPLISSPQLYVIGGPTLKLIDEATAAVVGSIPIPEPCCLDVAVSPDGRIVYLLHHENELTGPWRVSRLDLTTQALSSTILTGRGLSIRLTASGSRVYVSERHPQHGIQWVSVLDATTLNTLQTATPPEPIGGFDLIPDGRWLSTGRVFSDATTFQPVAVIDVNAAGGLTFSPAGTRAYLPVAKTNERSGSIAVVDTSSLSVIGLVELLAPIRRCGDRLR